MPFQIIKCADDKVALDQEIKKSLDKAKREGREEADKAGSTQTSAANGQSSADNYLVKRLNKRITDLEHQVMEQEEELEKLKTHSPRRRESTLRAPVVQPTVNGTASGHTGTKKVVKKKKSTVKK